MIQFMIGISRSGKSTFARKWKEMGPNRVIICEDDIRLALTGKPYFGPVEPVVHAISQTMIRVLHNQGMDVLVDETHTTEKSILDLLYIDPNAEPIWFPSRDAYLVPNLGVYEISVERARLLGQEYLLPVIDRQWQQIRELAVDFNTKLETLREKAREAIC